MILITGSQTDDEGMRHLNDPKVSSALASARSPYTVTLANVKTTAASSRGPDTSPAQPSPAQPSPAQHGDTGAKTWAQQQRSVYPMYFSPSQVNPC